MEMKKELKYHDLYIEAMKTVISFYERAIEKEISSKQFRLGIQPPLSCPLCDITDEYAEDHTCYPCPNSILGNIICDSSVYNSTNPEIQRKRIEELKSWIQLYEEDKEKQNV